MLSEGASFLVQERRTAGMDNCEAELDALSAVLIDESCVLEVSGCDELKEIQAYMNAFLYPISLVGLVMGMLLLIVLVGLSQAPAVPLARRLQHYARLQVSAKDTSTVSVHDFYSKTDGETSLVPEQHHEALQRQRGESEDQSEARTLAMKSIEKGQVGDIFDEYGIWENSVAGRLAYRMWQICGFSQWVLTAASLLALAIGFALAGQRYHGPCFESLRGVSVLRLATPIVLLHPLVVTKVALMAFYRYNMIQGRSINAPRVRAPTKDVAPALLRFAKAEEKVPLDWYLRRIVAPPIVVGLGFWFCTGAFLLGATVFLPLVSVYILALEVVRRGTNWCNRRIPIKPEDLSVGESDDEDENNMNTAMGRRTGYQRFGSPGRAVHPINDGADQSRMCSWFRSSKRLQKVRSALQRVYEKLTLVYETIEECCSGLTDNDSMDESLFDSPEFEIPANLFCAAFWWTDGKREGREMMIRLAKASVVCMLISAVAVCSTLTALSFYASGADITEGLDFIQHAYTQICDTSSIGATVRAVFDIKAITAPTDTIQALSSLLSTGPAAFFHIAHILTGINILVAVVLKPFVSYVSDRLSPLQSTEQIYRTWVFVSTMIEAKTTENEVMMKEIRRLKKSKRTDDDALRRLRIMGYTLQQLLPTQKFDLRDYRLAGHTCVELRDAGVSPVLLVEQAKYPAQDLKAQLGLDAGTLMKTYGIRPVKLKTIKYTLTELFEGGATLKQLKKIGYNAGDLRFEVGASLQELLDTGFTPFSLVHHAKASVLELREIGYSARKIRYLDFTLDQLLQETNFTITIEELRDAGYFVSDFKRRREWAPQYYVLSTLKKAGYGAQELRDNGFTVKELVRKGDFSVKHLRELDFSFQDLQEAEPTAREWREAGYTAQRLKGALGYDPLTLARGGFTIDELVYAGFDAHQMRIGGKGFPALPLIEAEAFTPKELVDGGYPMAEVKKACETHSLKNGASSGAQRMAEDGFSAQELKEAGATCVDIYNTGVHPSVLKHIGFSMKEITEATGKDSAEFLYFEVGFRTPQLQGAGYSATDMYKPPLSRPVKELYECGYSCMEITVAGAPLSALKEHYGARDLRAAGWTHVELKEMRFNYYDLRKAGFSDRELLREAHFTMQEVHETMGFTAHQLFKAGFTIQELKEQGVGAGELVESGLLWAPSGVQTNVEEQPIIDSGWVLYSTQPYSEATTSAHLDACPGRWILIAARESGSSVLRVAACCPREEVLKETKADRTHEARGIFWYRIPHRCFGFAESEVIATRISNYDAFRPQSELRLSWVLDYRSYGGRRAGSESELSFDDDWEKLIYYCE